MVVNETIEYVIYYMGCPPPYDIIQYNFFLAHHGILCGMIIDNHDCSYGLDISNTNRHVLYLKLNRPALIIVKSKRFPEQDHCIFWDGTQVWDPNPDVEDDKPLSSYFIKRVIPLTMFEGTEHATRFYPPESITTCQDTNGKK
jgi:hypothetical protein